MMALVVAQLPMAQWAPMASIVVLGGWLAVRLSKDGKGATVTRIRWHCLGVTRSGAPRHPLYVPAAVKPKVFFLAPANYIGAARGKQ